jgi:Holliday junction resolvase
VNSRNKGKRGERQWRDELRSHGYQARRGQQFSGSPDSPDVVCDGLPWIHFEVKAVERLNIEQAMEQARRDARRAGKSEARSPKGRARFRLSRTAAASAPGW